MKYFENIYKHLQEVLLPAIKMRAKRGNWPGVHRDSYKTYKYNESRVGIELSFMGKKGSFVQNHFNIEWSRNENVDEVHCQEECSCCPLSDTEYCPDFEGLNFRYTISNMTTGKVYHKKIDKAITKYLHSLEKSLEENDKFNKSFFYTYQVTYGQYEFYIPFINISDGDMLLDLIDYILVKDPFKLPEEIALMYEKKREERIFEFSLLRNSKEEILTQRFLKEFVDEEFFSDKKEQLLSLEERRGLFDKMKKDNPYFAKITNKLNLKI